MQTEILIATLFNLETDYNPSFQFNRTDFWVKTTKNHTTKYTGPHWEISSEFLKDLNLK